MNTRLNSHLRNWIDNDEFEPNENELVEVKAKDNVGTYTIRFPVRYRGGIFMNDRTGERLDARVVGWREWNRR
jgi:hypothetical protein